jgi:hypothetical protein
LLARPTDATGRGRRRLAPEHHLLLRTQRLAELAIPALQLLGLERVLLGDALPGLAFLGDVLVSLTRRRRVDGVHPQRLADPQPRIVALQVVPPRQSSRLDAVALGDVGQPLARDDLVLDPPRPAVERTRVTDHRRELDQHRLRVDRMRQKLALDRLELGLGVAGGLPVDVLLVALALLFELAAGRQPQRNLRIARDRQHLRRARPLLRRGLRLFLRLLPGRRARLAGLAGRRRGRRHQQPAGHQQQQPQGQSPGKATRQAAVGALRGHMRLDRPPT